MVKVLVVGDVKGSVTQLLAKVAQYHKSGAGPFDMVFAVGPLTSQQEEAALSPILAGDTPPAVPLYFFEAGGSENLRAKLDEDSPEVQQVASNLYYLGRGGIKTVGKLTVAFLASNHRPQDLESCRKVAAMGGYGGADMFLSAEWGRGMEVDLPERCFQELSAAGVAPAAVGSEFVAELAVAVKPRYHFAASEGAFFQRPPYRNYGSGGCTHTTRFIALGELAAGSAAPKDKSKKWVHALNLEPIAFMKKEELQRRSADTTDCPYVARKVLGGAGGGRGGGGVGGGAQGGGDKAWASRISAQEDGRRADSGMFFWGGRGGGRGGAGRGGGGRGPSGPVDPNNTTVFVGNLRSGDVSTTQLETLFKAVGPLSGVRIAPGSAFGFVEFERHQDAARAISSMEGFAVGGNQMRLSWGNHKPRQQNDGGYGGGRGGAGRGGGGFAGRGGAGMPEDPPVDPDNTNVFVGNLPKDGSVTSQDLTEAFVSAGCKFADIVEVRLMAQKGYAFAEFASHAAAAKAIESMHDRKVKNFNVNCKWGKGGARSRQQQEPEPALAAAGVVGPGGPRDADPRKECWFCLASPQLEDHLVCSVADEIYLAQPKGGLVPGHVLIVPVSHQQRYSELSVEGAKEAERYKDSFRRYCASCECEPLFFERCVPTRGAHHLHIQAVPVPSGEATRGARILMKSEGTRHGMAFQEVPADADLRTTLKEGQYFYAELPGDVVGSRVRLLHRVAEGGNTDARGMRRTVPLQFGRDVAARLLSMPERAHWRDCALPKPKEILQADIFKEAFKSFDFTQQEDEEGEGEGEEAAEEEDEEMGGGDGVVSGKKRPAEGTGAGNGNGSGGDESGKRARE